jgi:hypothetical protein
MNETTECRARNQEAFELQLTEVLKTCLLKVEAGEVSTLFDVGALLGSIRQVAYDHCELGDCTLLEMDEGEMTTWHPPLVYNLDTSPAE